MKIAGFTRSQLPFDMFKSDARVSAAGLEREAAAARRSAKLSNIYHRGQGLAWDGRSVLAELVQKHGGVTMDSERQAALARIFAVILWGELAAWKISAQLADRLVPLEAKMAATSQVHDEARHFYVMHDYLQLIGYQPQRIDRASRAVLDLVLNTNSLLEKLIGMQLMVETLALTIFQLVREAEVEPVLCDLLVYFERDEARHVGLGIQHLPELLRSASRLQTARAIAFQLQIAGWTLRGLQVLEADFAAIGIDARRVIKVGQNKIFSASDKLWSNMGMQQPPNRKRISAGVDALADFLFPRADVGRGYVARLRSARALFRAGGMDKQRVNLAGS